MPYFSGTATSAADLITAITNAATANGWTLSATGTILSKGNVYAQLSQWNPRDNTITDKGIGVQAGTGQSSGVLTNPCNNIAGMRTDLSTAGGAVALTYPCTYYIFVNTSPDEIVVVVNFNAVYWQWLGFGQANTIGITGLGIYSWGSFFPGSTNTDSYVGFNINTHLTYYNQFPCFHGRPFDNWTIGTNIGSSHIHLSLDSQDWWQNTDALTHRVCVYNSVGDILRKQPNTWNSEALLVRTQIMAKRVDDFWSYVAEFPHFRFTRNTYIDDATVITLGSADWFVAPMYKKDLIHPLGVEIGAKYHSGTNAFAVRKTT